MSNRLTFSLASLVLIFAFAFIAMPVMGAPGGPTFTIEEYNGKDTFGATTGDNHVQTRDDFRLEVEFSIPVTGWADSDIVVSGAASLTSSLTAYTVTVTAATGDDAGKVWYVTIDMTTADSDYAHSVISASIAADAVNGNIPTNQLGNQAGSANFQSLPGATNYNIAAAIDPTDKVVIVASGADKGKLTASDTFNVLFTYSGATGAFPGSIPAAQIQIKDKDGKNINDASTGVTPAASGAASGNVSTAILTVGSANVAAPIQVGVNPNWAGSSSTFVWIPKAPDAADPTITTQPTAEIEISSAAGLTTMPRAFVIEVTFTPGEDSDGDPVDVTPEADFHTDVIKGTDSGDNAVSFTKIDSQMTKNSYRGVLQYNTLSTPPLTIKLARTPNANYQDTSDPTGDATGMVGGTGTTPPPANAPAKPNAPMAAANATNDLIIDVSWTAPADNGSVITGYTVKKYDSAGMLVKTFPETGDPAITTTSYMVGPVPPADRGMSFTFTVAATNANGTSAESDKSAVYTVPAAQTPANKPPFFPVGSSIADIVIWRGHAYTTPVLPKASDDEGDTLGKYTITPDLPDGLRLVANDVQDRTITGKAMISSAKRAYKFSITDSANQAAELSFNITVLDPIVPSAPTAVRAMEEGDLGSIEHNVLRRTVNSNKVVVNWRAPVDTTETSHEPAIPFGAPITGYVVLQADEDDSNPVTYPLPGATAIKKDASTYTTPAALMVGGYNFRVAAVNTVGRGAAQRGHVTVANPPGPASDLRASKVLDLPTSATLDWIEPIYNGGLPIEGYLISKTLDGGPVVQAEVNDVTFYRWKDLDPGRHVFRVAAFNYDGVGTRSDSTTFSVDVPPLPSDNVKPTFGNETVDNITATVDTAITGRTLPAATDPDGDDGDIVYTLSPNPVLIGLNFNADTRFLDGTPSKMQGASTYTYTAKDVDGATTSLNFTIQVMDAPGTLPSTALIDTTISLPSMSIPAHGFVVLQRNNSTTSGIYEQVNAVRVGLANLDHLFRDRGGIALKGPGAAKDLVFSEIMWGSDSSLADDTHSQWIELYNTTVNPLELSNYMLEFYSARIAPTPGSIDEINTSGWGDLHGQRGRTSGVDTQGRYAEPVEIISMYRKINYSQVMNHDKRVDQLKAVPGGSGHGSWAASTRPSLNIAATWRLATPGAQPRYTIHGASSVPRNVIISEVGNSATSAYDWFELYNTTDGEINLKKWQLSAVTNDGGKGKEVAVLRFPDNDNIKIPAKSYLVIAASNPKNDGNDLAAGIDITKGAVDQVPRGLGQRGNSTVANYAVLGFSLPDAAQKSLLILRNGHGNEGKAAGFIDVIGTLSIKLQGPVPSDWTGYDKNNTVYYNTSLWPLHATGGPHNNVIDGTGDEDFRAGKVYQRNNFGGGTGEKHLAVRGYTGVGYDRHASVNAENGGTPGYSKDVIKGDKSNWMNQVSISEIMLVTEEGMGSGRVPRATRLPQWFEIYNASLTEAVSINNWYLEIQNDDTEDFLTNLHGTLRLPNVIIQPNQTVLVVSGSGLSSPNFPEQRTINVFTNGTYRQILGLRRRGEPMLNPKGFYIELRDHKGNQVDEIGNLGVSRRTGTNRRDNFGEQWEFPTMHSEDGHRTSLIRVYDNGDPSEGLSLDGWMLASNTNFRNVPSLTYYGNHRDFGTPGYRGGGPLPVSLSKFRPERLESGDVVIRWITQSELNNAGFNILRSDTRDGEYKQINTKLIAGQGTTSEKTSYEWKDTSAKPNVVYYYQIQDVSIDGQTQTLRVSRLKGNVTAAGKATTTWGELKALQ